MKRAFLILILSFILIMFLPCKSYATVTTTSLGQLKDDLVNYGFPTIKGDLNGDGFEDLIVVSQNYDSNRGRVYVFFGGQTLDLTPDFIINGEATGNLLGGNITPSIDIGDLNGDGINDLVVAALEANKTYIFYGEADMSGTISALDADEILIGDTGEKRMLGYALKIKDLNADGKNDLVLLSRPNSDIRKANMYIYKNVNGVIDYANPTQTINLTDPIFFVLGYYSFNIFDINNDSYPEIIGLTGISTNPKLYIYKGESVIKDTKMFDIYSQDSTVPYMGRTLASDDINGDGIGDLCFGDDKNKVISINRGRVYCFYGRESWNSSYSAVNAEIILNGFADNDNFGRDIYLNDITNDGKPDMLIGAYQANMVSGLRHGKFFIYKNTGSIFDSTPWYSDIKTSGNTAFGNLVGVWDYNNSGWPKFFVLQGGEGTGGTGKPAINLYSVNHGEITTDVISNDFYNTDEIILSGNSTDSTEYKIAGVEWSTGDEVRGNWNDCTATDGDFNGTDEDFSCDLSALPDDEYEIFFRTHDENDLYIPQKQYIKKEFVLDRQSPVLTAEINNGLELTNSTDVLVNFSLEEDLSGVNEMIICENSDFSDCDWESYASSKALTLSTSDGVKTIYAKVKDRAGNISEVENDAIILDTINSKPVIMQIGLLKNIPDKDNLYYYFNANRVRIYGTSETGSTVQFERVNGTKYTTQADGSGNFLIIIDIPNGETKLTYNSTDLAGNVSGSRTITLNIDPGYGMRTEEDTQEEVVVSAEETEDSSNQEETEQEETPVVRSLLVVDSDGNILPNKTIVIEGKEYKTDERGYIHTDQGFTSDLIASIEGRNYTIKPSSTYLTLTEAEEENKNFNYWYIIVPFLFITVVIVAIVRRSKVVSQ